MDMMKVDSIQQVFLEIRKRLQAQGTVRGQEGAKRFFKEELQCYGVRVPACRSIAREIGSTIKGWSYTEVIKLCELLLEDRKQESLLIAFAFMEKRKKEWISKDFERFESWLKVYVTNWAACDDFCGVIMGPFLLHFSEHVSKRSSWISSLNRWLRRAAAVSLIDPIRQGVYLDEVLQTADALLRDTDDMVQKGYGWMLKEAAHRFPQPVFDFVMQRKDRMPRTALRYAIEKMPLAWKERAMHK